MKKKSGILAILLSCVAIFFATKSLSSNNKKTNKKNKVNPELLLKEANLKHNNHEKVISFNWCFHDHSRILAVKVFKNNELIGIIHPDENEHIHYHEDEEKQLFHIEVTYLDENGHKNYIIKDLEND